MHLSLAFPGADLLGNPGDLVSFGFPADKGQSTCLVTKAKPPGLHPQDFSKTLLQLFHIHVATFAPI